MLGRGARTRSEPYSLFKQPISFPRRTFAPGVCILASLTPNEGWAERRETFGCVRSTRGARRIAARQAPSALRPMTQQYTGRNNVTISTPDDGSVPIVSQTEIEPIKTALSLMFALVTTTAPPPVSSNAERLVEVDRLRWMDARSPH